MMKENKSIKSNLQNHPSFESKFKPQKPSIKVDYKVIHSSRTDENMTKRQGRKIFSINNKDQNSFITTQNTTQQALSINNHVSRVKSVEGSQKQYESGRFIESEYCTNDQSRMNQSRNTFSKGKVVDARQKYQYSKSVQNIIKKQYAHKKKEPSCFVSTSRTQRQSTEHSSKPDYISRIRSSKLALMTNRSRNSQINKLPSYSNQGIKDIMEYEHAGKYRPEIVTPKCGTVQNEKGIKDKFRAFNQIHDFDFRKRVNTLSNQVRLTKGLR